MHNEVTYLFEKYVSARLYFANFRSECLKHTKFTQGHQYYICTFQNKKGLKKPCIANKHLTGNPYHQEMDEFCEDFPSKALAKVECPNSPRASIPPGLSYIYLCFKT